MKIVHVPFCFYPDPVGGTEIYVQALAGEQQKQECEVLIAAPGERDESYRHDGIRVRRFGVAGRVSNLRDMYGDGDISAAASFARTLDEEKPDLIHLHAFTRGASLRLVREAKRREIPVVFSYHTSTASCQRGTLLRWGTEVCEGTLDLHACTRCTLHGQGLNKPLSFVIGNIPVSVGRLLGNIGASGGPRTALRMTELVGLRHSAFRALMAEVDHVVALCDWVKDLLLRNGLPSDKVTVSRQGLCYRQSTSKAPAQEQSFLRVAFVGRLDPTKGVHILIEALALILAASIRLDVYGVVQGQAGKEYLMRIRRAAARDMRITFYDSLSAADVTTRMQQYDVLAVPSQGLETGPMVVLEAFAAGIPVVGSNLGSIAELVQDGVDGILLDARSPMSWAHTLERLSVDRALLKRLRSGVRPPRSMKIVAKEMLELYRTVLQQCVLTRAY